LVSLYASLQPPEKEHPRIQIVNCSGRKTSVQCCPQTDPVVLAGERARVIATVMLRKPDWIAKKA